MHLDFRAVGFHLFQRGKRIKIFRNVRVEDFAIVFCHIKRTVSEQLLERKRITAAINQIFPCKRVSEQVDARFRQPSPCVVAFNTVPQGSV